ncbi:MAG: fibronectin type III domain-containing protein, partial [Candidatus Marinimicrobia bacterium]|nr:fibronectin type III domain-containing protein [Candidatus Neomarinimicrobiota bacterium]
MSSNNNLKAKTAMTTILLIAVLICAMSCKECPAEPDYDIYLTVEDVFSTSVVLSVTLPDSGDVSVFALDRDDSTVATYNCNDDDTLIIDEGLTPNTDYLYRVRFLKDGKTKAESDPVSVHTLDTTSHTISNWDIDTLGISGGIYDLWIVSEDNIWAVGEIIVDDPDSSFNGTGRENFNAARWDGEKWNLMLIWGVTSLHSIYYINDNNIWVTCLGYPIHWDGNSWTLYRFQDIGIDASAGLGMWGNSPSNIYFVGLEGAIVRYNGSNFTKMESGTTCRLEDVWGIDDNHIWAVGTETNNSRSVILFYNGKEWKILHDTDN